MSDIKTDSYGFEGDYTIPDMPNFFNFVNKTSTNTTGYQRGYIIISFENNYIMLPMTEDTISQSFSENWNSNDENELIAAFNLMNTDNSQGGGFDSALNYLIARNFEKHSGTLLKNLGQTGLNLMNKFKSGGSRITSAIAGGITSAIGNQLVDSSFRDSLLRKMNMSRNPNKQLFFGGPEMRGYNFSWNLIPTDSAQNNSLIECVLQMINAASPRFVKGTGQAFFNYPSFFSIKICSVKSDGNTMTLFSQDNLAVTNFDFNLGTKKTPTHDDGLPVSYSLKISFKESEIPVRENLSKITFLGKPMSDYKFDNSFTNIGEIVSSITSMVSKGLSGFGADL